MIIEIREQAREDLQHGFQRLLSKRFPFSIYYTVDAERVRVSAVLDCRRDPHWIQRRLGNASQRGD